MTLQTKKIIYDPLFFLAAGWIIAPLLFSLKSSKIKAETFIISPGIAVAVIIFLMWPRYSGLKRKTSEPASRQVYTLAVISGAICAGISLISISLGASWCIGVLFVVAPLVFANK